ncbi:MAG: 2-aminoethylphosphonate--pyruvate transaminase [Rhodospirillaceae bacterium]
MRRNDFPHCTETGDSWLLTPGPLTTSASVKRAMGHDWGSRDADFLAMVDETRRALAAMANGGEAFAAVLLQGSGTYAVEAMLTTLVPRDGKLLVLVNGAYGRRAARICDCAGRAYAVHETPEDAPPAAADVAAVLAADPAITHVFAVHCETTSGILNPLAEIAEAVRAAGRRLLVDAMSSFGALPLDVRGLPCEAVAASSNKCLEGVPGLGFVIARRDALAAAADNAASLCLDLCEQEKGLAGNGQFRFTPPVQVVAALHQALREHAAEGGVAARGARYRANCDRLVAGMRALGFETMLADAVQAPIIVTFRLPRDPGFVLAEFHRRVKEKGYVLYPGKLTAEESFRIGCIGHIAPDRIDGALAAIAAALAEMGVRTPLGRTGQ